jgi:cell division protein FtsB
VNLLDKIEKLEMGNASLQARVKELEATVAEMREEFEHLMKHGDAHARLVARNALAASGIEVGK